MEDKTNTVFTEIEIHATAEEVWNVLTDWKHLAEWSTSFVGISAEKLALGNSFMVYFKNPINGDTLEFERVCTVYEEGMRFGWSGALTAHGLSDNHIFTVQPTATGSTLFRQEDGIHGPLSKLANVVAKGHMKKMYEKFNQQLKQRVESLHPKE
jgi:hypothetical protein